MPDGKVDPRARRAFELAREALIEGADLDAKLLVLAGITVIGGAQGIKPVLTGGTTVDFYAAEALEKEEGAFRGWRASLDVDIIAVTALSFDAAIRLRRALHAAGFVPPGGGMSPLGVDHQRGWRLPSVPIPVEVIGSDFHADPARIVKVTIEGFEVHLRGPEDTLWEHVEWAAHTGDQRSWTRALAIAAAQRDRLDVEYLRHLAGERRFPEALEACLAGKPLR